MQPLFRPSQNWLPVFTRNMNIRPRVTGVLRSCIDHLVIVAGGKGQRLAGLFPGLPKALVPIGGTPVLAHQLELAATCGIGAVTILAGHLSELISDFVGDGSAFGVKAEVVVESEPLGSAGALIQHLDVLPENFFVLYGDVMAAADLPRMAQFHVESNADFTCLAHPNDHPLDSDLLEIDENGHITAIHAYPHPADRDFSNLVNAALYVLRREALRPWSGQTNSLDFIKNVMSGMLAAGANVYAYRSSDYAKDMGTPKRLDQVEADWQAGKITLSYAYRARAAVFLNHDITSNVEKSGLCRPAELELYAGVGEALIALRQAGICLVVLTNQPIGAAGEASECDIAALHRRLEWELGKTGAYVDRIYVCHHQHDPALSGTRAELKVKSDRCKPSTGLIVRACQDLSIDASKSWMVGVQTRDMELARCAGLRSILLQAGAVGHDGRSPCAADHVAPDLYRAVDYVLADHRA
jgi:histidinol-phosphate phosphatase family protein